MLQLLSDSDTDSSEGSSSESYFDSTDMSDLDSKKEEEKAKT